MKLFTEQVHSPTLDTVQMVEETIKDAKEVISVAELKRRLPRQVNHYTLKAILRYLQASGKIEFTPDGVVWISQAKLFVSLGAAELRSARVAPKEDLKAILSKGRTWI